MKNIYLLSMLVFLISHLIGETVLSQEKWSLDASIEMTNGDYFFEKSSNNYFLNTSINYQYNDFTFSFLLPIIASFGNSISQFGNFYLPNQNQMHSTQNTNSHQHGVFESGMMSDMDIGVGDVFLNSSYNLINDFSSLYSISIDGFIKVPIANKELGFGSGEFDYSLSASFKKYFKHVMVIGQVGYLVLGDPAEIEYLNPISYGVGIGTEISKSLTILIKYDAYSKVLEGFKDPKQISAGLNIKTNDLTTLTVIGSKGFSDLLPRYDFSFGINRAL